MADASVMLVEDEPGTRERLARAIDAAAGLELVGAVGTVAQGRELLERARPDVLLTDIGLPDGSGIDLISLARKLLPNTLSMAVTILGDERTVLGAIRAGAAGYLLKDGTSEEIADCVSDLIAGGSPISAPIARYLLRQVQTESTSEAPDSDPLSALAPHLTEREREVLSLVARGFSSPEIARMLSLSPHTVKTHVRHIYEKLEVNSRGEAVYRAIAEGLVRVDE